MLWRKTLKVNANFAIHARYVKAFAEGVALAVESTKFFNEGRRPVVVLVVNPHNGFRTPKLERALRRKFGKVKLRAPMFSKLVPKSSRAMVLKFLVEQGKCTRCGEPWKELTGDTAFFEQGIETTVEAHFHPEPRICRACGLPDEQEPTHEPRESGRSRERDALEKIAELLETVPRAPTEERTLQDIDEFVG